MTRGMEKGEPHLPQSDGDQSGEIVSRRRGRPPRQIQVSIEYRPQTEEKVTSTTNAVRLLLREMVRRRMSSIEEENHD